MNCLRYFFVFASLCCGLAADPAALYQSLPNWYVVGQQEALPRFKCRPYIALACELQKGAVDDIHAQLKAWAAGEDSMKVIVLCRMLFEAKAGGVFRAPRLGWGSSCARLDKAEWPLDPIAVVGGIPFLVSPRYSASGRAETALEYLAYCREYCVPSTVRYQPPSEEALREAVGTLSEQVGGSRKGTWTLFFKQQTLVEKP